MGRTRVNDRMKAIAEVAGKFEGWGPARDVLTEIRSFETIFPQFDIATRVNGLPLQRVVVVHGPSNHGKTLFIHGLGLSALRAGHFYSLVDAEHTTSSTWTDSLMSDYGSHPGFNAMRPKNFEEVRGGIRHQLDTIIGARDKGILPPDIGAVVAVDSQRKLIPKGIYEKLAKDEGGVDGMGGRAGQIRAAMTAAWLDEVVPLFNEANATLVVIAREVANPDKKNRFDKDYKVSGGTALNYESSLSVRIERAGWVSKGDDVIGERHRGTIHKTKIGGKDGKKTQFYFHSSNGLYVPAGFDRARDVFEIGRQTGRITGKGAWFTDNETGERWNGENAAVKSLADLPTELFDSYAADVIASARPVELDEDAE